MSRATMTEEEAGAAAPEGWTAADNQLQATFATGSFLKGVELINAIAPLAEQANHHPDVELGYPSVIVRLTTHDAGGLTQLDVDLAGEISSVAAQLTIEVD
ncbi:4a-hydroxytetrahydrobiopterin dehydratase [Euzebya tangerina]|uniref:4a-hydroxytetrahydrobiopterin dehydratase n=1 Tax=Euzebya tangerina TaxID=591198 RepID=UPI0013C33BB3|nr:4a-hydroxytetrahydrobiopterin dehydratase [Euzebya tangerina]